MGQYRRCMKGCKLRMAEKCGTCYFWQKLDLIDDEIGVCQHCNQSRRARSEACNRWIGKVGRDSDGEE